MTRLLIVNSILPNANWHLITSLWRECQAVPGLEAEIAQAESVPLLLRRFTPDIVLCFGGEALTPELLARWRDLSSRDTNWILWTTEDPFELEANLVIAPRFDHVFTSDHESRNRYSHASVHYLPLAADPAIFFRPIPTQEDDFLFDLIFVGTAWPNRTPFLSELIREMHQKQFKGRFLLPPNPHLSEEALKALGLSRWEYDMRVAPGDLASLQNRSRFALLLFRDFSRHTREARPQTSPTNRFYETALAGCVQIAVSDRFDVVTFYPELEGAVLRAEKTEQILDCLKRARQDSAWRQEAAIRTQQFVLERHLYRHRVQKILTVLGEAR